MISLVEQVELEFARAKTGDSLLLEQIELSPQHRPRRFGNERTVVADVIAKDQRGGSLPRQRAQRPKIRTKFEIAETRVPIRDLEAVERIHLQIHREQVIAPMSPVLHDRVEKMRRGETFADQSAKRIGKGNNDGVNGTGLTWDLSWVRFMGNHSAT